VTSRAKVCAASLSPSAMVRYGHHCSASCVTVALAVRAPTAEATTSPAPSAITCAPNSPPEAPKFFRTLGDPARLRLLEFLLDKEHTVSECVAHVGLSQGRVSSHLACLYDCGYVQLRRQGRFARYKVSDPRVADLVLLARSLAADNAAALAACMRISPSEP
jgi:ArsR family transcriptional regulator, cadmium/lead-responsive transcriptional repressor